MNTRTFNTLGGFQSMLFCIGIYVVALFFSIFICSAIFKAVSGRKSADISTVQSGQSAGNARVLVASR
jgi:nitrate reductase gamma subunit